MNWDQIEGQWRQRTGELKSHWAKLTDDDLKNVEGKRDRLIGILQERYGVLKEDAELQIEGWMKKLKAHDS